jgi:glycerol-3-phosphate dehydrogenase (NAD(P)+)
MLGVQVCGASKNVIAIACGIVSGLGLGQNARSALLSFAIREIINLGLSIGAKERTFLGLCGMGDLILTASSSNSRNTSLGEKIAAGLDAESIIKADTAVCEGYEASKQIRGLSDKCRVQMPICSAVYQVLHHKGDPRTIVDVITC